VCARHDTSIVAVREVIEQERCHGEHRP
jgi:hypothetical protein